jgi:hypothetical protein
VCPSCQLAVTSKKVDGFFKSNFNREVTYGENKRKMTWEEDAWIMAAELRRKTDGY